MNNREGVKDLPILAQSLPASGWFIRRLFYPPFLWRAGGFIRRLSGGPFSVKVTAGRVMQTNHYP